MDSSTRVEGGLVGLTPEQLIQEFISLRVDRWRSKQKEVPDERLAVQLFALSWDCDSLPPEGPGCLISGGTTGHIYIPYDDSREGLPPEIEARIVTVDRWFGNSKNAPMLREMDNILRSKVDDICYLEFLDGGNASRIDFFGKIKMLARYRLLEDATAVDVCSYNPNRPEFKMIMVDVNEFGQVKMEWVYLDWHCTEAKVVQTLDTFSNPKFSHEEVLARLLEHLDTIHNPEELAQKALSLVETFKSRGAIKDNPNWKYLLCDDSDLSAPLKKKEWTILKRAPNAIKMMKRESREASKTAIVIRSSLLDHYLRCHEVYTLQQGQIKYDEENNPFLDEPYFNGGWVSTLEYAWNYGLSVLGGEE